MSSIYGKNLQISLFGQSHGPAVGVTLDGIPAGLPINMQKLADFLQRRAPGSSCLSTARSEKDIPQFISGIVKGFTCGAPITAIMQNEHGNPDDYLSVQDCPRPGHADYTAQVKYKGYQDTSGGGHFSGRLTAPICVAGGLCIQWLLAKGIQIGAHIAEIYGLQDRTFDPIAPDLKAVGNDFPVLDFYSGEKMKSAIIDAKNSGDSVGGVIECAVTGVPAGFGDPIFDGIESKLAQIIFSIPGVKGLEFGSGFEGSRILGSENNDPFAINQGIVSTLSNNCGGILGGITNGMPLIFRVAVKPTPSIAKSQQSISFQNQKNISLSIKGRHDPCIVPRAVPVVEAAAAIALYDLMLQGGM